MANWSHEKNMIKCWNEFRKYSTQATIFNSSTDKYNISLRAIGETETPKLNSLSTSRYFQSISWKKCPFLSSIQRSLLTNLMTHEGLIRSKNQRRITQGKSSRFRIILVVRSVFENIIPKPDRWRKRSKNKGTDIGFTQSCSRLVFFCSDDVPRLYERSGLSLSWKTVFSESDTHKKFQIFV